MAPPGVGMANAQFRLMSKKILGLILLLSLSFQVSGLYFVVNFVFVILYKH